MNRRRREFTQADKIAIRERATDESGRVHCERCGRWCPKRADYEIDHVLAEGMRPAADLKRKLTPADGQLLCVAACHPVKTKDDKGDIGEAKRREAYHLGIERPGKVKLPHRKKRERQPYRPAVAGKCRIAREYGL